MQAVSIRGKTLQDIKTSFDANTHDDFVPTLAIAFISSLNERDAVRSFLKDQGVALFGLSSFGEFIDDDYEGISISMMLLDLDPEFFRIQIKNHNENDPSKIAYEIGEYGKSTFSNPAFIISSSNILVPSNQLIRGLVKSVGEQTTIIGGNAAAKSLSGENHVFTTDELSFSGMITLILDTDRVEVNGAAISGWKPVGTFKKVTKCDGDWILTIDDKPALDSFLKYLGKSINEENIDDLFEQAGTFYPLQVEQEHGDPVMRAPMFFNKENRSFICAGSVPEGSMIQFSLPPDFEVAEKVIESSNKVKDSQMPEAEAVLIFSCLGRLSSLGPMVGDEIIGLQSSWDTPIIGFFTFGEYGKIENGTTEFHNSTVSWAALKEKV